MSQPNALIIDDNAQNLKILARLLSKQGTSCTGISDPRTLVDTLPDLKDIDVVFLDLEMPGMDGYRAKDLIRSHLGNIPIIAYTVHVSEIGVVRELGFDGFLAKPLDTSRFPSQLARILNGEPVWERV